MVPPRLAVLAAAGDGARLGRPEGKARVPLAGRPLYLHSLAALLRLPGLQAVAVVTRPQDREQIQSQLLLAWPDLLPPGTAGPEVLVVEGGATRTASVHRGLRALARWAAPEARPAVVLVHDAARPLPSPGLLETVASAAGGSPGRVVAPATPVTDSLRLETTPATGPAPAYVPADRTGLWQVQTPQAAWLGELLGAYDAAAASQASYRDELTLGEAAGLVPLLLPGERGNLKVTVEEDLKLAEQGLRAGRTPRVGIGFDVHPLVPGDGRGVRLAGVTVPAEVSLQGHSDADVAIHALMDAILGAAAAGDIGGWFAPGDPRWRGADSVLMLAELWQRLAGQGWLFGNADLVIAAEAPRLSPHYPAMRAALAQALCAGPECIGIKATTAEGLGFVGRREGISALASVLLWRP